MNGTSARIYDVGYRSYDGPRRRPRWAILTVALHAVQRVLEARSELLGNGLERGKPAENPKTLPFCSPRCRDVDLNRWLSGRYVIPGKENEGEDEE